MECSICLTEINTTTGSATLCCTHTFHFGCLARWMLKNESCPNCRHEANEKERINEDEESETDSEYESTEFDSDEDFVPAYIDFENENTSDFIKAFENNLDKKRKKRKKGLDKFIDDESNSDNSSDTLEDEDSNIR